MTNWSTLFPGKLLISRTVYPYIVGAYDITAPAGATIIRCSMVGGGAERAGAAFARYKGATTPGEAFSLVIGKGGTTIAEAGGNSTLTRVTGSVLICRADGAEAGVAGTAGASIGDTTRSGSVAAASNASDAGASAGDDADPYPLGYGGAGAHVAETPGNLFTYAYPGAGGLFNRYTIDNAPKVWPGAGRATVEFFRADPGY